MIGFASILIASSVVVLGDKPQPPVYQDPPPSVTKQGTLGRKTVRYYIGLQRPAIRYCYVGELARRPRLRARVAVSFTIEPDGKVTGCSSGPSRLERCVARAVSRIQFPRVYDALSNGVTITSAQRTDVKYRFSFRPAKRKGEEAEGAPPQPSRKETDEAPAPSETGHPTSSPSVQAPVPAAGSATQPVQSPKPTGKSRPARQGPSLPKIKLPSGDDPLEGIELDRP